jgi:TRAP-type C4-dicarboxylate transport system permease small subunit
MEPNRILSGLKNTVDTLTAWGALIGGIFTGIMTVIVGYAVVGRYILNRPIGWSEEIAMYLMVWAVFLGAAYTLKEDAHIGVDVLVERLRPGLRKDFRIFHYSVGIVFFSILLYKGIQMVALSIKMNALSMAIDFPLYIAHLSVPVGSVILILQCLNKLLELCDGSS